MTPETVMFLRAALGDEAAEVLRKAAGESRELGAAFSARAVVGWVGLAARYGYDGAVPGLAGSYLRLAKAAGGYEGEVRLGKAAYEFRDADIPRVAAGLALALGAGDPPPADLRGPELAELGRGIDLLLKSAVLREATTPAEECSSCDCSGDGCACRCHGDDLDKAAGTTAPGEAAQARPPAGPVGGGFTAPKAKQPRRGPQKLLTTKLSQSQARAKCSVCGTAQFSGDLFLGCECLRDLAKHAKVDGAEGGYRLTFDQRYWRQDDVAVLLDIVSEAERS